jgi:multidrug efflux pump subunit AcrA (membrane-fusion protein)
MTDERHDSDAPTSESAPAPEAPPVSEVAPASVTTGPGAWLRNERVRRVVSFGVPILVGIAMFMAIRAGKEEPAKRPPAEQGKRVRVIEVAETDVVPRAVGYGIVQAGREWQVVAQVSGRVIEMHEDLEVGKMMVKGTELLRIDPSDYKLAASQRRAGVESITAQIGQIRAQEKSAKANRKIEKRALELAERDLDRSRSLFASGNATQADVDGAERAVLQQKSVVQKLENQLRELPANRAALAAQAKESKAGLDTAALDIERTALAAPFTVRIRELNIQPSDIVTAGQVLAVADGIDVAEVPAQLTLGALQPLLPPNRPLGDGPMTQAAIGKVAEKLNLTATIRLESGDLEAMWEAKLTRFTTVDATTRTIGVVVAVDKPFENTQPGQQPPLLAGMYVEVELRGAPRKGCKPVPRSALRDGGIVHIVDAESRLVRRPVKIGIRQATFACIGDGLAAGERVVLTDLVPAVEGMLLAPSLDERATKTLATAVSGGGAAK